MWIQTLITVIAKTNSWPQTQKRKREDKDSDIDEALIRWFLLATRAVFRGGG